jgi:hypothetical protein
MPVRSVLRAKVASRKQKLLADGGRDCATRATIVACNIVDDLRAAKRSQILAWYTELAPWL